jgi:hypothetical protein
VKFAYDHVFPAYADNAAVYQSIASPIVKTALDGINGTIFAYGVTSSGKTHTMMGEEGCPGVVPHTIAEAFNIISKTPRKEFLIRMSMMEIYNEVLNDLFDPKRTNLRLREDPKRGIYVENLKEETVLSAEHALQLIAMGNEHRKTSATAFNEGSSRSHTIIRLTIEASDRADMTVDDGAQVGRTLSFLNLIDLAGSESAKAQTQSTHRLEGSFINKSLLTLGTVINKLSEGGAAHIPFRDSKLTRLLQGSLTGNGARVAVICTITPTSAQAEETHNTLKFASRAKKISITAKRNEIMDQSSLIARYQQEISLLKGQLDVMMRERGEGGENVHNPMSPEVRTLRERLEEEHAALATREREKAILERRLDRLTACVLNGAAALSQAQYELEAAGAEHVPYEESQAMLDSWLEQGKPDLDGMAIAHPGAAAAMVRSAGDLACSKAALAASAARPMRRNAVETRVLRHQVVMLAEEIAEREKVIQAIRSLARNNAAAVAGSGGGGGGGGEVGSGGEGGEGDDPFGDEATKALLEADRQYNLEKLREAEQQNEEMSTALQRMRDSLAKARGVSPDSIDLEAFLDDAQYDGDNNGDNGGTNDSNAAATLIMRKGYDHVLAEKVLKMEKQVVIAIEAIKKKDDQLHNQRNMMSTLTGLDANAQEEVEGLTAENENLRLELDRVEMQVAHLQGHDLDDLNNEQLSELISTLGQSVERVRVTVQLRRLAQPTKRSPASQISLLAMSGDRGGMGRGDSGGGKVVGRLTAEEMREAIEDLKKSGHQVAAGIGGVY